MKAIKDYNWDEFVRAEVGGPLFVEYKDVMRLCRRAAEVGAKLERDKWLAAQGLAESAVDEAMREMDA
jgi:hypothetical protein